jgi:hypothetical protein
MLSNSVSVELSQDTAGVIHILLVVCCLLPLYSGQMPTLRFLEIRNASTWLFQTRMPQNQQKSK